MARLPQRFRTCSWVPNKKYHSCRHYYIWDISDDFLFILKMVCCVYSLESPRWGDFNKNTQHSFMLKTIIKIQMYPYSSSWPDTIINPRWLELPLSRTNFRSPKGVRAIEVRQHACLQCDQDLRCVQTCKHYVWTVRNYEQKGRILLDCPDLQASKSVSLFAGTLVISNIVISRYTFISKNKVWTHSFSLKCYSRTSVARILMARVPWLFLTHSWVPWKRSHSCWFGIM